MRLELGAFEVKEVVFGAETGFRDGVLSIDREALRAHLLADSPFEDIEMDIARPGEETRIVHALDVVEPRIKVSGPGCVFPGLLGPPSQVGEGRTHRLAGMAVVGTAEPFVGEEFWYAREAIIDMSGPGACYSPFSRTFNLVLTFVPKGGDVPPDPGEKTQFVVDYRAEGAEAKTKSTRILSLKAASWIANAVKYLTPDRLDVYELSPVNSELPKLVYLHQTFAASLYGAGSRGGNSAVIVHPNELMDGALVNARFWFSASMRDATYLYQNNAIVEEMCSRHGRDLDFRGVILFTGFGYSLEDKERESSSVAKTARMLGADGAVLAPLSDGHPSVGHMLVCQRCEQAGIRTVLGVAEFTTTLSNPGITFWVPEADAMVVPGDHEQKVALPSMKKVIGGSSILNTDYDAAGPFEIEFRRIYGATSPVSSTRLGGKLY